MSDRKRLFFYTAVHFLVDLTCIYRMFSFVRPLTVGHENWIILIVFYNFLAFALPALFGLLSDLADADHLLAAIGCLLVACAAFFRQPVLPAVIFLGVGNGLFHVGAGRSVLTGANGKYAPSGIFICSGALGVYLGIGWSGRFLVPLDIIPRIALFAAAAVFLILERRARLYGRRVREQGRPDLAAFFSLTAFWLFVVVILRSYYGFAVVYDWKQPFGAGLIFTGCIAAGKAAGGLLADRFGVKCVTVVSLAGAAVTVLFSAKNPPLGCLSILLFNMTMPLTLTLLAEEWKPYPGFAFGFLMLGLFLGTIPNEVLGAPALPVWGLCLVSLVSLALLLLALRSREKERN